MKKPINNVRLISCLLGLVCLAMACCRSNQLSLEGAEAALKNARSSPAELRQAIDYLDVWRDHYEPWLEIARDTKRTANLRRMSVNHVFDHYVCAGLTLEQLCKMLRPPVNWIHYDQIAKIGTVAGWLPRGIEGYCPLEIPVLPDENGDYRVVILISFESDIKMNDVIAALRGNAPVPDVRLAGCNAFDSMECKNRGVVWIWK